MTCNSVKIMRKKFEKNEDDRKAVNWTDEERENIVGFFDLLLKIDKRHNPEKYVRKNTKKQKRLL